MGYNSDIQFIVLRLVFIALVAAIALKRRRNPFGWMLFGFVLPPIALLVVWLSDTVEKHERQTTPSDVESAAYATSIAAGNEPNVAVQDARAARERYNALPERRK